MTSSDRRIAAAAKIDEDIPKPRDTWPSPPPPPPAGASSADDTDKHDTIPTPAPEAGTAEVVVIPPLHGVELDRDDCGDRE
jgi:hypothetical protein